MTGSGLVAAGVALVATGIHALRRQLYSAYRGRTRRLIPWVC